jgi:hypothetical protein
MGQRLCICFLGRQVLTNPAGVAKSEAFGRDDLPV